MGIQGISNNYVYNTNTLSRYSLNKVNKIPNDVLQSKTEIEKTDKQEEIKENENPLKQGETKNYQDVVQQQMIEGQNRANLLFGL